MATVQKRGDTYRIKVSCGYGLDGKQIIQSMTWKPEPGQTPRQIEKELERQKVLFEERCKSGLYMSSNMRFADFAETWMEKYAKKQHKEKTIAGYKTLLSRIIPAIGHLQLGKIQPHHLLKFYDALQQDGTAKTIKYRAADTLIQQLDGQTDASISRRTGLAPSTVHQIKAGHSVNRATMDKLITGLDIDEKQFVPTSQGRGLSPKTILHHHRLISSMLQTAVQWQLIASNPCTRVKPPRVRQQDAAYLSDADTARLLSLLDGEPLQFKTMITLFIYSGVRRGELLGLKWQDVDFQTNHIHITRAILYTPEKGVYEDTPKNEKSKRYIALPISVMQLLKSYKAYQAEQILKLGDRWQHTGYIFTGWDGRPLHPDTISSQFKRFATENGFPGVHLHSLRHTNASLLIASGVDLRTVSNRLGHAQLSTTGNIYAHAIQSADELAACALENILKRKA